MLPVSHKMATQYYTPMLAAAYRALSDVAKFTAPESTGGSPDENAISAYFHLMLMWRRFDRTLAEKGGIYFKSPMGES